MKLTEAVTAYIAYKQSLGMRFVTEARTLKSFVRALGDVDMDQVDSNQVHTYLSGKGPVTRFWHRKFDALRGFYRFALARGHVTSSPLPIAAPQQPQSFEPYIYSRDEIKRLIASTDGRERCNLSPLTCRTLLLLLFGTGLRISEALHLDLADVNLDEGILRIRETKFYKTRLVPTGRDLTLILAHYRAERDLQSPTTLDAPFLLTQRGQRISRAGAEEAFKQIRKRAGVHRNDNARYQPRLHDMRHSFAVMRLISWYREGADVQKLLPPIGHLPRTCTYLSYPALSNHDSRTAPRGESAFRTLCIRR